MDGTNPCLDASCTLRLDSRADLGAAGSCWGRNHPHASVARH